MKLSELYDAYAAMEQLPIDARAAAAAAAKRRTDTLASLDDRASRAKKEAEATKTKLQADLREQAQRASALGAIPKGGATASGAQPNFGRTQAMRQKLEGLLNEQKQAVGALDRLKAELAALEKQIADELANKGLWAKAKAADVVTYAIGGITVLLSILAGPGKIGVGILALGLTFVAFRFMKGRSARMMNAARKRPAVGSHPRVRFGYVLTGIGWAAGLTLILSLVITAVARASAIDLSVGSMDRSRLDPFWFLGLAASVATVILGLRAQRASA